MMRKLSALQKLKPELYKLLVSEIKEYAIFILSPDGYILSWNKGAENIKGYKAKEIIGKPLSVFYTKTDKKNGIPGKNLATAKKSGSYEFEGWRVRKDGSLFWANNVLTTILDENKNLVGFAKITKEITQRKLEEDKFKGLLEAAPDATVISNKNGEIILVNEQVEVLFGYHRGELTGKQIEILVPAAKRGRHVEYRKKYMQDPQTRPMGSYKDLFAVKKDGTEFPVEISLSPLQIQPEPLFLASIRDSSERIKLTQTLKKKNEDLRQLSAYMEKVREEERKTISREIHDELGSLLTALKMDISWIGKKYPAGNENINHKMKDANELINRIIKTVRKISSELRPNLLDDLGLVEALQWFGDDYKNRTGINVEFSSNISTLEIQDDVATAFFRIYQEALNNTAKHSGATSVKTTLSYKNNLLSLAITDNGSGFDMRKTSSKRTLGLLGIQERTALVNGTCNIKSTLGKGTSITVTAPI